MRLLEYEGKELLRDQGIATPPEKVALSVEEAAARAAELGYPVVVKAQVLAGGRGKAGGIRVARDEAGLRDTADALLGMRIKNERCEKLLVAAAADIARELYAGVTIDAADGRPVFIFSTEGGMDIESVAHTAPDKVLTLHLSPLAPPRRHTLLEVLRRGGLSGPALPVVCTAAQQLIEAFFQNDCTTLEINPLILTSEGTCLALDAKAVIDDAALKRQKRAQTDSVPANDLERRAAAIGVNYVLLEGEVAVIAGGAGLAMATMDMVNRCGRRPASFLDTGGGISSADMAEALRVSIATPGVRGVVINIFGGINNCGEVAGGIARVLDEDAPKVKIAVKMRGHSQDEGWALLEARHIPVVKYGTTEEVVRTLIDSLEEA